MSAGRVPDVIRVLEFVVPPPGFKEALLRMSGVKVSAPVTYSGDVYLTPLGVEFNPQDPTFRESYFANLFTVIQAPQQISRGWGNRAPPDVEPPKRASEANMVVDLTRPIQSLAQSHAGEHWAVTVALVANPGSAAPEGSSIADLIDLGTLELEVR